MKKDIMDAKGNLFIQVDDGRREKPPVRVQRVVTRRGAAKLLMCEVCLETFTAEDDVTHTCGVCDRGGFCEECSSPSRHDCEPKTPGNAEVSDRRPGGSLK